MVVSQKTMVFIIPALSPFKGHPLTTNVTILQGNIFPCSLLSGFVHELYITVNVSKIYHVIIGCCVPEGQRERERIAPHCTHSRGVKLKMTEGKCHLASQINCRYYTRTFVSDVFNNVTGVLLMPVNQRVMSELRYYMSVMQRFVHQLRSRVVIGSIFPYKDGLFQTIVWLIAVAQI